MFAGIDGGILTLIIGALGGALAGTGKAIQWYVGRLDAKTQRAMQIEADLRRSVEKSFEERIKSLEQELVAQRTLIEALMKEKQLYLRRIYQLEAVIHGSGTSVPAMEGWPP